MKGYIAREKQLVKEDHIQSRQGEWHAIESEIPIRYLSHHVEDREQSALSIVNRKDQICDPKEATHMVTKQVSKRRRNFPKTWLKRAGKSHK